MIPELSFETWKGQVADLLRDLHWSELAVLSLGWEEWFRLYYVDGLSPEEAVRAEYDNAEFDLS